MKSKMKHIAAFTCAIALAAASCSNDEPVAGAGGGGEAGDGYPLKVCVVSGEELGSMGKPVEYEHGGTLVKFCCKSCIPKFEKEPEKYLAKLKGAKP